MKAFITGLSSMDGSHLAELLLSKGYEVYGTIRRHSNVDSEWGNSLHLRNKIKGYYADLTDANSLGMALKNCSPDEVYHLAAQSHVGISSYIPESSMQINAIGTLNILEQVRQICPWAKFYNAATSELFGNSVDEDGFQRETTYMAPVSPYAIGKLAGFHMTRHYREGYGMFTCNGILFNHCSPRRGRNFVTQKIVKGAWDIRRGLTNQLTLGNLKSSRDDGHAKDYVRAMWMMLQHWEPDDYVVATGETHTVEEFADIVFSKLGLDWKKHIVIDQELMRPQELHYLKGDASKIRKTLGWSPEFTFETLIEDMLENA